MGLLYGLIYVLLLGALKVHPLGVVLSFECILEIIHSKVFFLCF
jgi:hypothetical protein